MSGGAYSSSLRVADNAEISVQAALFYALLQFPAPTSPCRPFHRPALQSLLRGFISRQARPPQNRQHMLCLRQVDVGHGDPPCSPPNKTHFIRCWFQKMLAEDTRKANREAPTTDASAFLEHQDAVLWREQLPAAA